MIRFFSNLPPPTPTARSENSIVCHTEMCFDGWVPGGAHSYKLQGLFIGPMSSFPVIYSNRFGVKTLHPTRYRPQDILKNVLRWWAALWEKRPMVAKIFNVPLRRQNLGILLSLPVSGLCTRLRPPKSAKELLVVTSLSVKRLG